MYIMPDFYLPFVKNRRAVEYKQKEYKTIQDAKRALLNIDIQSHEIKYQEYEHQYQKELHKLKIISSNNIQNNPINLFDTFNIYMNHQTNRMKLEVYHEKIPIYRRKLLRTCRRRQQLKSKKNFVNVAPKIILDLTRHPFTTREIAYLSRGHNINAFIFRIICIVCISFQVQHISDQIKVHFVQFNNEKNRLIKV